MRAGEHVAGGLDHALLEGEMRDGVVHRLGDHVGQRLAVGAVAQFVQAVDVVDDAPMLDIDFLDAGVQLGTQCRMAM